MIRSLSVRNLAVIRQARVEFGEGLNVVTGETGAGKSLIVDSLSLLAGGRASSDLIRTGQESLTVTGVFQPRGRWRAVLCEAGVPCDDSDELVVRREVNRSGRNRIFLNDHPVTLRLLGELGPELLRIHGQRDELGLLSSGLQREWLDASAAGEAESRRERCARRHDDWMAARAKLEKVSGDGRLREERIDLLRFQTREIEEAAIEAGEETSLREERELLRHAESIGNAFGEAIQLLDDADVSASGAMARAKSRLEEAAKWHPAAGGWAETLEGLRIQVDDLVHDLRSSAEQVEMNPARLNAVEDRLALLERLLRKYGDTTEGVLSRWQALEEELNELQGDDEQRAALEVEVATRRERYLEAAQDLSEKRGKWAKSLARRVVRHLGELALPKAQFEVALDVRRRTGSGLEVRGIEVDHDRGGYDRVEFRFSSNPGSGLLSLAKAASGGELARVFLALQVSIRRSGEADPSVLVFDEVDAGVGGVEAAVVGRHLKDLAAGGQILSVTHLPQVASFGDHHLRVRKEVGRSSTAVVVEQLAAEERELEVARMLAGEVVTELSVSHARELLADAARSPTSA